MSFYASDLMVDKIRQLVSELRSLNDVSKAENLDGLLKKSQEDALRIIRAIRFASQLGFTIEPLTFEAIQQYAHLLPKIAVERVRIELSKYFQGNHFKDNALLLFDTYISQHLPLLNGLD